MIPRGLDTFPAPVAPMPLTEGVHRLSGIAVRRLNTGQGPRTVLAWLGSSSTQRIYGSLASAVVARVIGGAL